MDHVGQDLLGVVESLLHFLVAAFQGRGQGVVTPLGLLVHVGEHLEFRRQDHFRLVREVDLEKSIGDGVPGRSCWRV